MEQATELDQAFEPNAPALLKAWRLRAGFDSLEELADATRFSLTYLADVESGSRPVKRKFLHDQILGQIHAAARRREYQRRRRTSIETDWDQVHTLGCRIAASLWDGCDDAAFVDMVLNEELNRREDMDFWNLQRRYRASLAALQYLSEAIGELHRFRDRFPFRGPNVDLVA